MNNEPKNCAFQYAKIYSTLFKDMDITFDEYKEAKDFFDKLGKPTFYQIINKK